MGLRDPGSAPHDAVLEPYMIAAPAGTVPTSRELNEAAAAEMSGLPGSLRRYRFSAGYERRWTQPGGTVVSVRLLRFRDAENAATYLRDSLDATARDEGVRQQAVAGIPGGRSTIGTVPIGDVAGLYVTVSAAAAGDVVVLAVIAAVDRDAAAAAVAEDLLHRAYARL